MSKNESKKKDKKQKKENKEEVKMPEEFEKIVRDLTEDIKITFPEYIQIIEKWWKPTSYFNSIEDVEERKKQIEASDKKALDTVFKHCINKFPPRFFDILYQSDEMFKEESDIDTEFLPQIHFKNLWQCDISDKTRETIWKYLQLIMFCIIGNVKDRRMFGDTAKLFDCISEEEFKGKLEETLGQMQNMFDNLGEHSGEEEGEQPKAPFNMPNANEIHEHINGMLNGKLGSLAKEIAEETAAELNIDMENTSNMKDVFQKLFKNPTRLMNLVKSMGQKLEDKIKSGEIKESELLSEASDLMSKMKNMPGMGNIQQMMSQMGMGGMMPKGAKMNFGAMESQLKRSMKTAQMKERMKQKAEEKHTAGQTQETNTQSNITMTDEEIISIFSTGEKVERTPRGSKPPSQQQMNSDSNKEKKKKSKK